MMARPKAQEGMRCLDEATAAALETEADIPISRAWTGCFLVTACESVRDFRRAFEWCDRIAEFVERAAAAARNCRQVRQRGRTVPKTIDCLVATFCLRDAHALLHADRDFDAFEELLHLEVVHP